MPGGRPSKYEPEYCDIVIKKMSEGASKKELCLYIPICTSTIHDWSYEKSLRYIPEFSAAIKKGESLSEAWWMEKAREALQDRKFNAVLWYMNMKNRFGWKDQPLIDVTAINNFELKVTVDNGDNSSQKPRNRISEYIKV